MSVIKKYNSFIRESKLTAFDLSNKELEFIEDVFSYYSDRGYEISRIQKGLLYHNEIDYTVKIVPKYDTPTKFKYRSTVEQFRITGNERVYQIIDIIKDDAIDFEFWNILKTKIIPILDANNFCIENIDVEEWKYQFIITSKLFDEKFKQIS